MFLRDFPPFASAHREDADERGFKTLKMLNVVLIEVSHSAEQSEKYSLHSFMYTKQN